MIRLQPILSIYFVVDFLINDHIPYHHRIITHAFQGYSTDTGFHMFDKCALLPLK